MRERIPAHLINFLEGDLCYMWTSVIWRYRTVVGSTPLRLNALSTMSLLFSRFSVCTHLSDPNIPVFCCLLSLLIDSLNVFLEIQSRFDLTIRWESKVLSLNR